ncbi:hypothetical protein [Holospora undulata]|uniref:Uncharacterized protein n=1 Tax=Holospora undulata HU1 TaxID=1321371 RepID=A0A061JIP4_9PROT|nr:hypothetical protein [Holospora undulata]ETZ05503.1 hypothetical protein K737_300050 [Holospora undulata HU1]
MVASIAFGIVADLLKKTHLEPKIILAIKLGAISVIPFMFMCLSFWLYKPLFLTNGAAKFSPSLRKELIQDLDEIPNSTLHSSWIRSFFYLFSKEAIFFLSSLIFVLGFYFFIKIFSSNFYFYYPYLSLIISGTFGSVFLLISFFLGLGFYFLTSQSFSHCPLNYHSCLLFILPGIVFLVFFLPFLINRYYPKGIVMFLHKISCARMITFPISFNCSILGGFFFHFNHELGWIIGMSVFHIVLHCSMFKIYSKSLAKTSPPLS